MVGLQLSSSESVAVQILRVVISSNKHRHYAVIDFYTILNFKNQ